MDRNGQKWTGDVKRPWRFFVARQGDINTQGQTYRKTDIATYRLNCHMGRFREGVQPNLLCLVWQERFVICLLMVKQL